MKLFANILISSVNILNVLNRCFTFCNKTCNNHCCTCTKVGSLNVYTGKAFNTLNNRNFAVYLNVSTHSQKLTDILKSVVPYTFGKNTCSLCNRKQHGDLRLHISRKSGVRHSFNVAFCKRFKASYSYCIVVFNNLCACFFKLCADRFKVLRNNVFNKYVAAASSSCNHICSCLNLVGND